MKIPRQLQPLFDDGLITEVTSQLMSGKEASIFIVQCDEKTLCAKVYKEKNQRDFKTSVQYKEGRKHRNSRQNRALGKKSKFGQEEAESLWQQAEFNALTTLSNAGIRVPEPMGCHDGVLLMQLITDNDGFVAPRLNDAIFTQEQALEYHKEILSYIIKMLCCGLIHGDLSEYNILVNEEGPVIIDLPQVIDASANLSAQFFLERDCKNITEFFSHHAPELKNKPYGKELWTIYEKGDLTPDTQLTGEFTESDGDDDISELMAEINAVMLEAELRKQRRLEAELEQ